MVQSFLNTGNDNYDSIRNRIYNFNNIARNEDLSPEELIKKYEEIVIQYPDRVFLLENRSSFFTLEDVTDLEGFFSDYFNSKIYSTQIVDIFDQLFNVIESKKIQNNTFIITLKRDLSSFLHCKSWKPIFLSLGITRDKISLDNPHKSTWKIHNFEDKKERISRYLHAKIYDLAINKKWAEKATRKALYRINSRYSLKPNFNVFSFNSNENNYNPFHFSFETEVYFINNKDILLSLDFLNKKPVKKHLDSLSTKMIEIISHKKDPCKLRKTLLTFNELKKETPFRNKGIIEPHEVFHGKPKAFNESFNNNWMNGFTILALRNNDIRTILGITEENLYRIIVTGSRGGGKQGIYPPDISILKREGEELQVIARFYVKNLKTCKYSEDLLRELIKSFGWSLIENGSLKYNKTGNLVSKAFNAYFIPAENPRKKNKLIFGMWKDGIPPILKRFSDIFDQIVNLATGNNNYGKWRYSKLSKIVTTSSLQKRVTDKIHLGSELGLKIVDLPIPWFTLKDNDFILRLLHNVNRTISLREILLYSLNKMKYHFLVSKSQNRM